MRQKSKISTDWVTPILQKMIITINTIKQFPITIQSISKRTTTNWPTNLCQMPPYNMYRTLQKSLSNQLLSNHKSREPENTIQNRHDDTCPLPSLSYYSIPVIDSLFCFSTIWFLMWQTSTSSQCYQNILLKQLLALKVTFFKS